MDFLDEEVVEFRKSSRKGQYNTLETGMYIKDELVHFKEFKILDDKVSVMLPDTFVDMPSSVKKLKYPSEHRPQVIKTSLDITVNFAFNLFDVDFEEGHIKSVLEQFRNIIRNVNPAFIFFDFIIDQENNIGWFDYKGYGVDEQIYNVVYIIPIGGKLMHGIFNCRYRDILEWKEVVHQIMLSITDCTKGAKRL